MTEEVEIGGKMYPVSGKIETDNGVFIPILDVKMMSDIKWQRIGYEDRLRRPDIYREYVVGDVDATIAKLKKWLKENDPESEAFLLEMDAKYGKEGKAA